VQPAGACRPGRQDTIPSRTLSLLDPSKTRTQTQSGRIVRVESQVRQGGVYRSKESCGETCYSERRESDHHPSETCREGQGLTSGTRLHGILLIQTRRPQGSRLRQPPRIYASSTSRVEGEAGRTLRRVTIPRRPAEVGSGRSRA